MKHVRLGTSGLQVSRLCLGTMTFGYQCDEATSFAILDAAATGGITFIDTADTYPLGGGSEYHGRTEEITGRWLHGQRERYVIATKCYGVTGDRPWDRGLSRRHILDAIDASLRRLGTDYVDQYQMHFPDWDTPLDESLAAMEDVVRAGKARYIGCSNFPGYRVARALGRAELRGWQPLSSVQPRYNLLFREVERERLPLCGQEGSASCPTTRSPTACLPASTMPDMYPRGGSPWARRAACTSTGTGTRNARSSAKARDEKPQPPESVVVHGGPGQVRRQWARAS